MPLSSKSLRHAFSLNKQTDAETAVSDGAITYQRGSLGFAPFSMQHEAVVSDQDHYGKANFGTFREVLHKSYVLGQQERPASDLDCLFALAFVMGGHAAAQGDPVGEPNTWQHTLTWKDLGTNPEVDYTSFLEQMGNASNPGHKFKFVGVWISEATISGEFGDFVTLSFSGGARELATSSATMPSATSTAALLKINLAQMSFGNSGSLSNIDKRWVSLSLTFSQNPAMKLRSGAPSGEEELICRTDRGNQRLTGSITLELEDTAFRQKFLAATEVGLTLRLQSAVQTDSANHYVEIQIPKIQIASEAFGEEDLQATYTITLDETSIIDGPSAEPVTVIVSTDIDNTEVLVVDP